MTSNSTSAASCNNDDGEEMACQLIITDEGAAASLPNSVDGTIATTDEATPATPTMEPIELSDNDNELQVGDHVYQWRKLLGIPWVFQHHGIVMDVIQDGEGKTSKITIADFSNVETKQQIQHIANKLASGDSQQQQQQQQHRLNVDDENDESIRNDSTKSLSKQEYKSDDDSPTDIKVSTTNRLTLAQEGVLRTYTDTDQWHKVEYEASWWKRQVYRSGTATKAKSDPVGLVLARVNFILQHPELLPDYHVVHANCECVAFWCKTGSWSTLQASSFLELTAAGQVKSSATLAVTAAGATSSVTVPAAGLWGWMGYTSTAQVSWLSLHPMAIPGLACYAVISIGVPAVVYASAHKQWKETSKRLCDAFWESAQESPEVFAECLTHWSDKGT